ncbi:hypothetical protein Glove_349g11 [Diversispora epigaea]|uniref:Uncharacterized protein n=1 Tax=Diversispora epigaea TaxID=1348612 RepID=A0A397HDM4_9GLOM|nr:hypothetical protein Glove_349g11 [Diversispora epigaea]
MANAQSTIDSLKELNLKLVLQIDELRKENAKVKAENTGLKQAIEENATLKIRFEELEKKNKTDTAKLTAENAELKYRVTKLEQKQTGDITNEQDVSPTKDILQSTACSELSVNTQSTISSEIRDESKGSLSIQLPIEGQSDKEKDVSPDRLPELEHSSTSPESLAKPETSKSSLSQDTINDDSVEILEFVETIRKENISNEIRERNRKKKLQIQGSMQSTSSSSDIQNEVNPLIDTYEHKTIQSELIPTDQAQNTGIKIPYNKRVEQGLRHDLSVFIKENSNKFSDVFDIKIPEFSLEVIITGSSKITAQNTADLFIIAMKVRQKEILSKPETSKSSLSQDTINDDSVEILEFVETIRKENISNEIRERNRKKKLQIQGSMQSTSSSSDIQNEVNPLIDTYEHKTIQSELIPTDQAQNTGIKIPYNKRVEQGLRHDLSVFIKENSNKFSDVFDIKIPEFSLEVIITGSSKITAQNTADLFIIAMKVRQKEILCWYCYYKAYEDRIEDIKCINKIDDQSARTLVYNEIKTLLPDITDVNLRQSEKNLYVTYGNRNRKNSDSRYYKMFS